jgi:ElaB/YqjD/DUF883 family membrane-anchored ribosome-binding protein
MAKRSTKQLHANGGSLMNENKDEMEQQAEAAGDKAEEKLEQGASKLNEMIDREKLNQVAEKAREQFEGNRERISSGLEEAEKLAQQASAKATAKASEAVHGTTEYLHSHDKNQIMRDAKHYFKEHPIHAVLAVVLAGFVLKRLMQ